MGGNDMDWMMPACRRYATRKEVGHGVYESPPRFKLVNEETWNEPIRCSFFHVQDVDWNSKADETPWMRHVAFSNDHIFTSFRLLPKIHPHSEDTLERDVVDACESFYNGNVGCGRGDFGFEAAVQPGGNGYLACKSAIDHPTA